MLITLANILSITIFVRKFRHRKPYISLINLSFADLVVGCSVIIVGIELMVTMTTKDNDGCVSLWKTFYVSFSSLAVVESATTLALIAMERAFAVLSPLSHRVLKGKHYRYAILLTWSLNGTHFLCNIIMRCVQESLREKVVFGITFAIVISSLIIMVLSYIAIYVKIRFFHVPQNIPNSQVQMKLCKTLFITTVASVIMSLPFGVYQSYSGACGQECDLSFTWYNATIWMVYFNSFVNVPIYAWKMRAFRREMKKIFC